MSKIVVENDWNYRVVVYPIVVFVTLFLIWASFSSVDEQVRGEGKVVPSSQSKVLQHLEGGIVEEIYAKEGQRVKKGDFIYKLKNSNTSSDSKQKEIELNALKYKKTRLQALINFDKKFTSESKNEMDIFNSQMQNFNEELSILQNTLDQNRLEKKKKLSHLKNLQSELKIAKENLSIVKKLLKKGAASKQQYLTEMAKYQSLITEISELKSSIPIIKQKIKTALTKTKSLKSEKKSKWLKELSQVDLQIEKLTQSNIASSDRESRKVVISPVNGIVKKLYFHTIGGIIKSGDKIAEITPMDDVLVIESKIKTNDRGQIWVDQNVSVEITAYNYAKYGLLKGKLVSISPDSFIDRNGESYYQVKIKAKDYKFAQDKPIMPGMVAMVNIKTGSKTIMEYILKPLKDIGKNALSEK